MTKKAAGQPDDFDLTTAEAAERLQLDERTVLRLREQGHLKGRKRTLAINSPLRFSRSSVEAYREKLLNQ